MISLQYTEVADFTGFDKAGRVLVTAAWTGEDRGMWHAGFSQARVVTIAPEGTKVMAFTFREESFSLRSHQSIERFLDLVSSLGEPYFDLTTLPYEIWAQLVRKSVLRRSSFKVVYVEPREYALKRSDVFREFDLSKEIGDIGGLPGFGYLGEGDEPFDLVALLGFEGARFGYFVEELEADQGATVYPLVGAPGFRPEFVQYAFEGNAHVIEKTQSSPRIQFARANCPFSAYSRIAAISDDIGSRLLKIALIGTRPHALGGVLFSILSQRKCALLFDYPTKRPGRSVGLGKVLIYDIGRFARENGLQNL